jgi:putative endonuclease
MMQFIVYILFSSSLQKYYVGSTGDFAKRIVEHNSGKGNFTSKGMPWSEIQLIGCASRSEAVILESKIKKRGIKRYLQDNDLL